MTVIKVWTQACRIGTNPVAAAVLGLAVTNPSFGADTYNPTTRQLTVPSISIGSATYTNVLISPISVSDVLAYTLGGTPGSVGDTYDPVTGRLSIATVTVGNSSYANVIVLVPSTVQVSIGDVVGADTYDGANLTIPAVQVLNGAVYNNVTAGVGLGDVLRVAGGLPAAVWDSYDPSTKALNIRAVQFGSQVYTNVTVKAGGNVSVVGGVTGGAVIADASKLGPVMSKDQLGANLLQGIPDVGEASSVPLFASAGFGLLRWPGGALSDFYHWQTNTYSTCSAITPEASFDTWMQNLVQPLGADVAITINNATNADCSGPSDPNEAAAWVNYANNTQHYGIKYWTIGNEQYAPPAYGAASLQQSALTYATRVATQFYPLMKAQDPTIQIGIDMLFGNGIETIPQDTWDPVVLANAAYDFVELHYYPQYDEPDSDTLLLTTAVDQVATNIATARALLAQTGHISTPIFLGEFDGDAGNPTGLGHQSVSVVNALFNALVVLEASKAGVSLATAWMGIDNCLPQGAPLSTAYGWQDFGSHGFYAAGGAGFSIACPPQGIPAQTPFPKARAYQILSKYVLAGEQLIGVQSGDSVVRAYAATNGGGYAFVLINTDPANAQTMTLTLSHAKSATYSATTLTYGKAQYDLSRTGDWAGPVAAPLGRVSASNFAVSLPPWSMTFVKLAP